MASDFGVEQVISREDLILPVAPIDRIARLRIDDRYRVGVDARIALADILEDYADNVARRGRDARTPRRQTDRTGRGHRDVLRLVRVDALRLQRSVSRTRHRRTASENPDRLRAIRRGLAKRHGVEYAEADPRRAKRLSRSTTRSTSTNWRRSSPTAAGAGTPTPSRARGRGTTPRLGRPRTVGGSIRAQRRRRSRHPVCARTAAGPPRGARRRHGFCFFNNAAVAAQTVLDDGAADRVAVFDWDVHHGNGTQDVFYDRGDVLYASIHEDGLYPDTGRARRDRPRRRGEQR